MGFLQDSTVLIKICHLNMQVSFWYVSSTSIVSRCISMFLIFHVVNLSKSRLKNSPQGITNTVGAIPGIVGVALTGFLLDSTHSWSVS